MKKSVLFSLLLAVAVSFSSCKEDPLLSPELEKAKQTVKDVVYPSHDDKDKYLKDMTAEERTMPLEDTKEYKTMIEYVAIQHERLDDYKKVVDKSDEYDFNSKDIYYYGKKRIGTYFGIIYFIYETMSSGEKFVSREEAFAFIEQKKNGTNRQIRQLL